MGDHDDDPTRRREDERTGGLDDREVDERSRRKLTDREVFGSSSADLSAYGTTAYADRAPSTTGKRRAVSDANAANAASVVGAPTRSFGTPRRRIAPWLASAFFLLVVSMLYARRINRTEVDHTETAAGDVSRGASAPGGAASTAAASGTAVHRFVAWVDDNATRATAPENEANHPFTSRGLMLLADALRAEATSSTGDADRRCAAIRANAERLTQPTLADKHAEYAHSALSDAATLLAEMRRGTDLQPAADAVTLDRPLSAQGDEVRSFFRRAAMAMR